MGRVEQRCENSVSRRASCPASAGASSVAPPRYSWYASLLSVGRRNVRGASGISAGVRALTTDVTMSSCISNTSVNSRSVALGPQVVAVPNIRNLDRDLSLFPECLTLPSTTALTFSCSPIFRTSMAVERNPNDDVLDATCRRGTRFRALIRSSARPSPKYWVIGSALMFTNGRMATDEMEQDSRPPTVDRVRASTRISRAPRISGGRPAADFVRQRTSNDRIVAGVSNGSLSQLGSSFSTAPTTSA